MRGCVGVIDRFFAPIILCYTVKESEGNPRAYYYFGHYQCCHLDVQAVCDASLCFLFFDTIAPGKTSSSVAYKVTVLPIK
jgi:hypothetical protein